MYVCDTEQNLCLHYIQHKNGSNVGCHRCENASRETTQSRVYDTLKYDGKEKTIDDNQPFLLIPDPSRYATIPYNMTSTMIWQQDNLPFDFVDGMMQDLEEFPLPAADKTRQEHRLVHFVSLRHGILQDDNFTFRSKAHPKLCGAVAQAMPVVAPMVRSLTLRCPKYADNDWDHIVQLLRNRPPLLGHVELMGGFPRLSIFTQVIQALSFCRRLTSLEFTNMLLNGASQEESQQRILQLALWQGLPNLQSLVLDGCSESFVRLLLGGTTSTTSLKRLTIHMDAASLSPHLPQSMRQCLTCSAALEHLTMDGTIASRIQRGRSQHTNLQYFFLAFPVEMPNLTSLTLGEDVTFTDRDGTRLSRILPGLSHLQSLYLPNFTPRGEAFGRALVALADLQELLIGQVDAVAFLTQCPCLQYLKCRPVDADLDALLLPRDGAAVGSPLLSLYVTQWTSDERTSTIFARIMGGDHTELRSLTINQGDPGPMTAQALEHALQAPTTSLLRLSLPASANVVHVLARLLGTQERNDGEASNVKPCCLTYLHLEKTRIDISCLLETLVNNKNHSLSSLSLHFKQLAPGTRTALFEMMTAERQLTSLYVHFDGRVGTEGLSPAEFAPALLQNQTLIRLRIVHNAKSQPGWNILTRLTSRRNLIRQWAQGEDHEEGTGMNHNDAALWPHVLEWLVPDPTTIFVVVRDNFLSLLQRKESMLLGKLEAKV